MVCQVDCLPSKKKLRYLKWRCENLCRSRTTGLNSTAAPVVPVFKVAILRPNAACFQILTWPKQSNTNHGICEIFWQIVCMPWFPQEIENLQWLNIKLPGRTGDAYNDNEKSEAYSSQNRIPLFEYCTCPIINTTTVMQPVPAKLGCIKAKSR